jgi:hypothetical protein
MVGFNGLALDGIHFVKKKTSLEAMSKIKFVSGHLLKYYAFIVTLRKAKKQWPKLKVQHQYCEKEPSQLINQSCQPQHHDYYNQRADDTVNKIIFTH